MLKKLHWVIAIVFVFRITCAPACIQMWDERGEPLKMEWRTDGTVAVQRMPGTIGIQTYDEDCGVVRFHMKGQGRWWRANVECGNGMRYLDLTRTEKEDEHD